MKISNFKILTLILFSGICPSVFGEEFESMTTPQLLGELSFNTERAREAELAIQKNILLKNQLARESEEIKRERTSYNSVNAELEKDLASYNTEVDAYNSLCGSGTFGQEALDQCESWKNRLESEKNSLDTRWNELESIGYPLINR